MTVAKPPTGIRLRHSRRCATVHGEACDCTPSYEAIVHSPRDRKKLKRTFSGKGSLAAAKSWRAATKAGVDRGTIRAPLPTTLREAADAWLEGARSGLIRNRSGDIFKPSVIRSYDSALRLRVLPDLGSHRLVDIRRVDVQDFADRMLAEGLDPSTIRNTINPLRVIYRRAMSRGEIAVNPTVGLELPSPQGTRDRIASPSEATELLDLVPEADRTLWATAFYAGLRRGELRGLRWQDVDLASGVLRVEQSWDDHEGAVATKSKAGRREVPIVAKLRGHLVQHRLRVAWGDGLVFGRTATSPFIPSNVRLRAATAWTKENAKRLKAAEEQKAENPDAEDAVLVEPIGLHEARHTFASLLIAAGVNLKAISTYMGHSSITITLDRYGHLMPGHDAEAVKLIDAYLERESS